MCEDCGCTLNDTTHDHGHHTEESVRVMRGLMESNDHQAAHNREHFDRHGVLCINLMSSPGAGKTRLLEATAEALGGRMGMAVIEGDLETENDARRLRDKGVPAVQITTGSACHLDAGMVHAALHELPLDEIDVVFVENVGNLVCPASFDLGQHANVVLLSVTEGDDKPAKYPVMFRAADLVVLSKTDLLEFMDDFDPDNAARYLNDLGMEAAMVRTAAGRRAAIGDWTAWLEARLAAHRSTQRESRPAARDMTTVGA
ncbi:MULTISPECIES: hydrogenase nickel incorporation protein HypB [unclassified Wenzhouxiangella]|uniref:hydrogenase nickel incorporation protein HypB n=1 Tax=unclassified Wenzhouxiangella TaxID=2613841 RepID=UPI000E328F52|nr:MULTISPECIES: hydrogenase nickel incorporation protein HypB [unclassified Wenzhouxiangella]RFF28071.1 hydrogenase accessory protein HypB [Wenzhouxiangella sp. 15181]RFP68657.1 hydrogenase accessory protein HypB [Wenzhouxiangella sp. 15190]